MKQKSLQKLTQEFYGTDEYINAFIDYLKENREISKYISLKDAKLLIKKNLHFSPYLEELRILLSLGIPQRYVSSIMNFRSSFVDTASLNGKMFFEYFLEMDKAPEINLPIIATVHKKAKYFHPSFSLESIIKVISVATIEEATYIFSNLNRDSDFPNLYYSFDEYIKAPTTNPSQAFVFLEDYVRICDRIENGLDPDTEKMLPDVFLET